jgi:hypothetical protein
VLLNANVAFLAIQSVDQEERSNAQRASYFSVLTSMGAVILGLLLTRQHQHVFNVSFRCLITKSVLIGLEDEISGQSRSLDIGIRIIGRDVQFAIRLPYVGVSGFLCCNNGNDVNRHIHILVPFPFWPHFHSCATHRMITAHIS